jgi:hypothetical protein
MIIHFSPPKNAKTAGGTKINSIIDPDGSTQTSTKGFVHKLSAFSRRKYEPILVGEECIKQMVQAGLRMPPTDWRDDLYTPITLEKLKLVANKGGGSKAPGKDGLYLEFFKET